MSGGSRRFAGVALALLCMAWVGRSGAAVFESGPVRPLASSPDGTRLFVVNTPDARLEVLSVDGVGVTPLASVSVGLEPVAVAARTNTEVWVVNHLSDSISVVDVGQTPPRVVRTLLVGDEPRDIVFGGTDGNRAFITTAHRGQNSAVGSQATIGGVGRADVWVFDATDLGSALGGTPLTIVTLFGDTPRALATSPDGGTVYAAVFKSGNRTTTVPTEAVCDGGVLAAPCDVDGLTMPGGLPLPNESLGGVLGPEVGLIVQQDGAGAWRDELGRDWSNAARFNLPDLDVFAIDATANPPAEVASFSGVGTVLFNMAVNPVTGVVYVSNTEARNETRLEPNVQGRLHEARITLIQSAGAVIPRALNTHIDYAVVPSPTGVAEASLATPLGMAVDAAGTTLYVAAFGSDAVGVVDVGELEAGTRVPSTAGQIAVSGGGPSGVVLDEPRGRAYVTTRFDNGVSVLDVAAGSEISHLSFHDPEPGHVKAGRRFLYDARLTSSNGEASCASCHVFGDMDDLAWDLGSADGPVVNNPLPILEGAAGLDPDFHPLKGPMTTQTLRGMASHGSMHWRGDRTGGNDPGGDAFDERAAFQAFNPAFVGLMGRASPLSAPDMAAFTDFVLEIALPPNPHRNLDDSLSPAQATGRDNFVSDDCSECHILDPAAGFFGTGGGIAASSFATQFMKVPHLRNLYQKLGRFFGLLFDPLVDVGNVGDQIRGFGFSHDGSAGRVDDPAGDFLYVFPSELKPAVGQQITLSAASGGEDVTARVGLLVARANVGDCDLVAKGVIGGEVRGFLLRAGVFESDRQVEPSLSDAALRLLAVVASQDLTYTCVPPGEGERLGRDRDGDGRFDRDELDDGTDPADAASPGVSPSEVVDAYVLYASRVQGGGSGVPTFGPVELGGSLGATDFKVIRSGWLAVPAAVNGEAALDASTHLHEYRLRGFSASGPFGRLRNVQVTNACGSLPLVVKKPYAVFLPAAADMAEMPTAPSLLDHDVGHFVCHRAVAQASLDDGTKLPGVRKRTQIDVQAGARTARYELARVTRLCRPTGLAGAPTILSGADKGQVFPVTQAALRHAGAHLVCYRARLARHEIPQAGCGAIDPDDDGVSIDPPQSRAASQVVHVADDFGAASLEAARDVEVCLPSQVDYDSDM